MEIEHIVKELSISQKAQFNLVELYRTLKHWFEINGYSFFEREYEDLIKSGKKNVTIKWEGSKSIDDYSKFYIFIKFFSDPLLESSNWLSAFPSFKFFFRSIT